MTFNLDIDESNFVDIEKLLEIIKSAQKLGHTKFHLVSINLKHGIEADDATFKDLHHQELMIERLRNLTKIEGKDWCNLSAREKGEWNKFVLSLSDDSIEKQAWKEGWRGYGLGGK
jgi:hypothetical protein